VLDLRAQTRSGHQFHIELQVRAFFAYAERALYYWAGLYQGQLEAGKGYADLRPVISTRWRWTGSAPGEEGWRPMRSGGYAS
jgi:predicted transposase/invertase (TIGR01784 family)